MIDVLENEFNMLGLDENAPLLSVDDLHTWFELKRLGFIHDGFVHAVDGVNFQLKHGEAIAIVGESGCGKTSLMKTILALYNPYKGDVLYKGKRLSELDKKEMIWYRSQVGYVQQDPYGALPPFMNVRTILSEPLIIHGVSDKEEREQRIMAVLDEVKLFPPEEFMEKFPHMLSGGQQQRVVIARAMILNPQLLIADEPVSMLDASVRVEILHLLEDLQAAHNLGAIYITHDLATVRYFSEYIFVMYAGKLIERARDDDILHNALHPYTQALLTGTSEPDAENADKFKPVPAGEPPSLVNPPAGCRFHPRCPEKIDGVCDVREPSDLEIEPEHFTACWLFSHENKS